MWEFWALGLICLLPSLIWFIIWLVVAYFIYKDANARGMNGVLWAIIVFFLGIIGLIIYVLVRKEKKEETRTCLGCGRQISLTYNVCPHCGKPVVQTPIPPGVPYQPPPPQAPQPQAFMGCPYCRAHIPANSLVCPYCGAKLR